MRNKKILILGATSAIAQATARELAKERYDFFLVGRNQAKLEAVEKDLLARGALSVSSQVCDLAQEDTHEDLFIQVNKKIKDFDTALIAYGSLGDQKKCEEDFEEFKRAFEVNFISVVSLLTILANYFQKKEKGLIIVISSVAGDRGRQSNYVYGSAKGSLSLVLSGLRNRLHSSHVNVLTVKPGFVDTPMTKEMKKGLLFVKPEIVGKGIVTAMKKGKDVVYLPWFWRYIMLIIKLIPESFFKRLKL